MKEPNLMQNDWRLQGQDWLREVLLRYAVYAPRRAGSEHDHCEFCWVHFGDHIFEDDPNTQLEGYVTDDGYHWICRPCFQDFRDRFAFRIDES